MASHKGRAVDDAARRGVELADEKLIADLPPFRDLPQQERAEILGGAKQFVAAQGAVLFAEGAPATAFFLLVSGRTKVVQVTANGGQIGGGSSSATPMRSPGSRERPDPVQSPVCWPARPA